VVSVAHYTSMPWISAVPGAPILTCEVNEVPPNLESMGVHERLGFRPLGRQRTEGGAKRVVLLGLNLA